MSLVRSKNPMSFFQLMPHLQCCKPMNCCFIFLPQTGQTLLLAPHATTAFPCSDYTISGRRVHL